MPDLTTLAAVKNWMAIPQSGGVSDTVLTALITSTSQDFLRAIDRVDLLSAAYTEVREGDGGTRLAVRHWPITAVASVSIAGSAVAASADQLAAGWFIDADLDPERLNQIYLAGGLTFQDGGGIVVAYTGGYVTVPADIAQAVIEWVADRYKSRDGAGVSSQRSVGGEHVAYEKESAMPATTEAVATRYRRTWPTHDRRTEDRDYHVTRINRTITTVEKAQ